MNSRLRQEVSCRRSRRAALVLAMSLWLSGCGGESVDAIAAAGQSLESSKWSIQLDPVEGTLRRVERRGAAGTAETVAFYGPDGLLAGYETGKGDKIPTPSILDPRVVPSPRNHVQFVWYQHVPKIRATIEAQQPRVILVGDSITWRWRCRPGLCRQPEFFGEQVFAAHHAPRNTAVAGLPGDRIQHVRWRLANGILDVAPSPVLLVMMVGINNMDDSPALRAEGLVSLVARARALSPGCKILLLGLLPASRLEGKEVLPQPNPASHETNAWLAALPSIEGVRFLDVGDRFLDGKGEIDLDPATSLFDQWGLHPRERGFEILADATDAAIDALLR